MKNLCYILPFILLFGCQDSEHTTIASTTSQEPERAPKERTLTKQFKDYWFAGKAEITSYKLNQERYGELREGTAVMVFVTEDFLPDAQVKADQPSEKNIPVLKLNTTKKFVTGIYPYSIMTSSFAPINKDGHAIKVSNSVQEWCGQTYMQLNNRKDFELVGHSYFQSEGDVSVSLEKTWLEDELWNRIRINPEELPTGELTVIPSFEYLRLRHKEPNAYKAYTTLKQGDSLTTYEVNYPELGRELSIYFESTFPYHIVEWEEVIKNSNSNAAPVKTSAVAMKRIKSAYWQKNAKKHEVLRDTLWLE